MCVVYGNCQAEAIRTLLDCSPAFRKRFRTQSIPAVHTVTTDTVEVAREAVAGASLIVSHPVRDGYHGYPVGSEEILECARPDCRRVTIPALYYDGLYPFQVYVRDEQGAAPGTPLSIYHDLRFLFCAGQGWNIETARAWLRAFVPSAQGIEQAADAARAGLLAHEAELDVQVGERLTEPARLAHSFFTVNHPTNAGMGHVVAEVHAQLGIPYPPPSTDDELLGTLRTPLEESVIEALELPVRPRSQWNIKGSTVTLEDLLAVHLEWYEGRRELVQAGLSEYEFRLRSLGITA